MGKAGSSSQSVDRHSDVDRDERSRTSQSGYEDAVGTAVRCLDVPISSSFLVVLGHHRYIVSNYRGGFNHTAVKTAVEGARAGGRGASALPARLRLRPKSAESGIFELTPRQRERGPGSYQKGIPSLVRTYEMMSAAGMRVLSPSGVISWPKWTGCSRATRGARLRRSCRMASSNCIRAADLVWLHAPDGYVGLSGALEIGFANAAGVPVYAEEVPSDLGLRPLVTISPLEQVLAKARTGEKDDPEASLLPLQAYYSAVAQGRAPEQKSPQDVVSLITEEIGELARQSPGQRQRRARSSRRRVGSSEKRPDQTGPWQAGLASAHTATVIETDAPKLVHRCRARHRCRNAHNRSPVASGFEGGNFRGFARVPRPRRICCRVGTGICTSSPLAGIVSWVGTGCSRIGCDRHSGVRRPVYSTWRVGV